MKRAIVIVDHGSRRVVANQVVAELARLMQLRTRDRAEVYFAHLEAAAPSLDQVLDDCVRRGAQEVLVQPLFLVPGRHAEADIPALVDAARQRHAGVQFGLGDVIGPDPMLVELLLIRCGFGSDGLGSGGLG
jgi:sirohydrochlorin ferrochelatase